VNWSYLFQQWFLRELVEALKGVDVAPDAQRERLIALGAPGIITVDPDGKTRRRPHEATLLPRPGMPVIASPDASPSYGDGRKIHPPGSRRMGVALVPQPPNPWFPLPPLHWHSASARAIYNDLPVWVPCWPIVNESQGWAKAPYYVDPATMGAPQRVRNHHMGMPNYFAMFRPEAFESTRPRASEYQATRQSRMLRLPWMAGWRNGRRFMRVLELPLFWVPEYRADHTYTFPAGDPLEGMRYWYPWSVTTGVRYASINASMRNDPDEILNYTFNTNAEELHFASDANLTQTDFPRGGRWDAAPNYGFLVYMLDRPTIHEDVRAAQHNPVEDFGLSLTSTYYRVLEVFEDDGQVQDINRRVIGYRITGVAEQLVRSIVSYNVDAKLKRISHVLRSEIGGAYRTASRWDHVVYDPDDDLAIGTTTLASGTVQFTMAFLQADDGLPLQGRHDVPYHERVARPFLAGHCIYEGPYGRIPAPDAGLWAHFAGVYLDDRPHALEVVRRRDGGLLAIVVDDDDAVTITRGDAAGQNWEVTWTGTLTDLLPVSFGEPLKTWPNLYHYRWFIPEWPTPVGSLWIRGVPFYVWERSTRDDRMYRANENPPYGEEGWSALAPVVLIPNGLPPTTEPLTETSY
jgi:hypothetical protein